MAQLLDQAPPDPAGLAAELVAAPADPERVMRRGNGLLDARHDAGPCVHAERHVLSRVKIQRGSGQLERPDSLELLGLNSPAGMFPRDRLHQRPVLLGQCGRLRVESARFRPGFFRRRRQNSDRPVSRCSQSLLLTTHTRGPPQLAHREPSQPVHRDH